MVIPGTDMPGSSFDARTGLMTLETPAEFSFGENLAHLSRSPLECMHRVEDGTIRKLLETDGGISLLEIAESDGCSIRVRFVGGAPQSPGVYTAAAQFVQEWFDLRTDLRPFYRLAETDPLLGSLASDYFGLRIVGVPDLFEALCWAVVGQQVNLAFAYTLKKHLVEAFGRCLVRDGERYWLFPKPADLAGASVDELRKLQFTGKKAEYVIGIAQLMESGELSKESLLAAGDTRSVERKLTAIRGIGPWTAHYVMMRCLRDPSALPAGDAGLQNALKRLLNLSAKPTEEQIRQILAPWRGWEAYAVFYLWRSLIPA
jgi:DNA-3-methyladenine glycosylase II